MDAARKAIENPLLETNLDGAKKVIFAVSGGMDLTPIEVQEAAAIVEEILDDDVNMIWGMSFDESFEDEVKVTIIATGFEEQSKDPILKPVQRNFLGQKIETPRRESENYITRGLRNPDPAPKAEEPLSPQEDTEVPAFLRRKMKQ